jgi:hypothetical protein
MFNGFSEAAQLFAKNYAVIETIRGEFERDINVFLDAVREELSESTSGKLAEKITKGYRYWWIGKEDDKDKDKRPQLWLEAAKAETVYPGEVKLTAIAPAASPDQLQALAAVAKRPEFSDTCQPASGGPYSLFTVIVKYGTDDPVQRVANVTARLLLTLNDVYETKSVAVGSHA